MSEKHTDWIPKTYNLSGGWSIKNDQEGLYLELDENFATVAGPDVKLFLTQKNLRKITDREMVADHGLFIQDMISAKGAQRYKLPVQSLSDYQAIVFHCERYSVVWGGIDLTSLHN